MAERLRSGLQIRVARFDSGSGLHILLKSLKTFAPHRQWFAHLVRAGPGGHVTDNGIFPNIANFIVAPYHKIAINTETCSFMHRLPNPALSD